MNLKECGSADLDYRSTRTRPTSLRTSDRSSLLRYMGLRKLPLPFVGQQADTPSVTFVWQRFVLPALPALTAGRIATRSIVVSGHNQSNCDPATGLCI
jgi:hypothetical protein